ncbi:hypothetical protein A2U01_0092886, partial [Trifolium medium]|nr:hypothetical protein [Trifolium medium]
EPPKSLLLGIGVMTLGSSSSVGEMLVVVLVARDEVCMWFLYDEERLLACS